MNLKLKSILCMVALLFCGLVAIHAQEKYVSQADIDSFISNFDEITNNETLGTSMDNFQEDGIPTTKMFVANLGKNEQIVRNILKEYGMNSNYSAEAFYTILIGSVILQMELFIDEMMLMAETEEERQMIRDQMQNDPSLSAFFELKESIHSDDFSLLSENFNLLSAAMPVM